MREHSRANREDFSTEDDDDEEEAAEKEEEEEEEKENDDCDGGRAYSNLPWIINTHTDASP